MLYNTKALLLHCVFHGIRFKVNEDWVSVIDTLLFFMKVAGCELRFSAATPRRNKGYAVAAYPSFFCSPVYHRLVRGIHFVGTWGKVYTPHFNRSSLYSASVMFSCSDLS